METMPEGVKQEAQPLPEAVDPSASNDPCPTCHQVVNPNSQIWIGCDECGLWYHDVCEGIPPTFNDDRYVCINCRKKRKCMQCYVHPLDNNPVPATPFQIKPKPVATTEDNGDKVVWQSL